MSHLPDPTSPQPSSSQARFSLWRALLLAVGLLSTALAVVGLFVPLLPTVPFLLLAAACFARSSERVHRWLLGHAQLGPILAGFLDDQGIPRKVKLRAIALIWLTISPTALWLVPHPWLKGLLFAIALAVSFYLWRLPERSEEALLLAAEEDDPQLS